jgi:hypothetical protein
MARINDLHKIKEAELLGRLSRKEEDIKKRDFEKGCDKQIENRILEEANAIKQENVQLKAKVSVSLCRASASYRTCIG